MLHFHIGSLNGEQIIKDDIYSINQLNIQLPFYYKVQCNYLVTIFLRLCVNRFVNVAG